MIDIQQQQLLPVVVVLLLLNRWLLSTAQGGSLEERPLQPALSLLLHHYLGHWLLLLLFLQKMPLPYVDLHRQQQGCCLPIAGAVRCRSPLGVQHGTNH